ncbi:hypothetical protein LTR35_008018 [Friedmanniomyces endolithicus]|nr:hypothetical protein LTS09_001931 [Friedmanniomyces endolithicus]KAK0280266.1 hypothetical protein LTS00_013085 [Friedmanniomyces endolithicus]KAK0280376.1 hypothetical protein LTR35_008018 [Friedmanniomyces endolithicus]KAK1017831.1 hypothetical protein LTR54_001677 [Friedmanniomyces endolithicus]
MATNTVTRSLPRALKRARWAATAPPRRTVATATAAVEYHDPSTAYISPPLIPTPASSRVDTIRDAKPFSSFLTDTHAREHDYLRISLTERCNLRCLYCMPEEGIALSPPATQLTTPEIIYLCQLFVSQGVNKIRLTGGEPTVRKDILELMRRIGGLRSAGLKELALTTNGISLWRKLDAMVEAGLTGVNISLDTLDPFQFQILTRRQGFDAVMKSINRVQEMNRLGAGVKLKINCVMMRGLNDHQILPFVEMTREQDVEVRFIEYMPFGGNKWSENKMLPYAEMLERIREKFPGVARLRDKRNDTSKTWQVPGFVGRVGFITSMTHNFCGTCNRLRITSDGNLKVCLHGETEVSLRDLLRKDHGGEPMDDEAFDAVRQIELDRRKGLNGRFSGGEEGWMSKERQLLETIGAAVKRKKAKHAGMGQLENMKNRPMILIGGSPASFAAQTRGFSSSGVCRLADDNQHGERASGLASTLGFQSLSGLFQDRTPPQGRYSRPRVEQQPVPPASADSLAKVTETQTHTLGGASKVEEGFFQPSTFPGTPSVQTDSPRHNAASPNSTPAAEPRPVAPEFKVLMPQSGRLKVRKLRYPEPKNEKILTARDRAAEKHHEAAKQKSASRDDAGSPSPWASSAGTASPSSRVKTDRFAGSWGLSEEDLATVDTFSEPDASITLASASPDTPATTAMPNSGSTTQATRPQPQEPKLTHVDSSGEAHMVDIGAKPSTRRVAVAVSFVRFSHAEPFRLIFENSNKKGDVLGVARIAGIMAAKRTADLIPLCHPIAVSKVDVEVKLIAPGGGETRNTRFQNNHGAVQIQATVETVGPTGVEMEALSAVSGAALTVYDMCKAVDRVMRVLDTRVVFKCGGRSGEFVEHSWAVLESVGRPWFVARGLEVPVGVVLDEGRRMAAAKEKRGKV